jgi:hypothetical protein
MKTDELKKRILSRRARFVAAALAASSAAACETKAQAPEGAATETTKDASAPELVTDAAPQPCLKIKLTDPIDGGGDR